MKKFAISLLALAAVSTVALAGPNRSESDTYFEQHSNQLKAQSTSSEALAVGNDIQVLTNSDRLFERSSEDRQRSRNN